MQILSDSQVADAFYPAVQTSKNADKNGYVDLYFCGFLWVVCRCVAGAKPLFAAKVVDLSRSSKALSVVKERPGWCAHFPARLLPIWRKKSMTFLLLPELPLLPPVLSYASSNFLCFCSLPPRCSGSLPMPWGYCARCGCEP
jgi:hypothetical protein